MKLLLATFNQGKLDDYRQFCKNLNLETYSLADLKINEEFEENFPTFEENAKAKAEFYSKISGLPTLADDSGIEIPFYNMEPGVKTKRWAGDKYDANNYFQFILQKILQIPPNQRHGQMRAVLALCINHQTHLSEGIILGTFTENFFKHSTTDGYPWDKVFIINELNKFYEELSPDENLRYNHRKIAFDKLIHLLK